VSAGSVYELGGVPYCACNMTLVEEVESIVFCIWAPRTLGFVWDILAIGRPIGSRCQVASQRRSEAAR